MAGSVGALALWLTGAGCQIPDEGARGFNPARWGPGRDWILETTGYCPCGACCGWTRNWLGRPVIAGGPHRGAPKQVGYTASGTRARPGTLAADVRLFPFGTIMYVPGYGYGRVEDTGLMIKGRTLDLFFRTHADALQWGRVQKRVRVWTPHR